MKLSRKILAGALVALLPMSGAIACTSGAWLGTASPNAVLAEDPDSNALTNNSPDTGAFPRLSGNCALRADAAGDAYVTDNNPGGEAIYRARFYVYTGRSGVKVFSATTADNGGGTEVIGITFTGTAFQFAVNGATVPDAAVPNAGGGTNRWYSVEFLYQASGAFQATVGGGNAAGRTTVNSSVNAGALTVGSARLGHIGAAGTGTGTITNIIVDEFDSSRSAATEIGRLCRADATGNGALTVGDISAIINERQATPVLAAGQPDCTENGELTVGDISCHLLYRTATPPNDDCDFS
jgi:hypothetical protein